MAGVLQMCTGKSSDVEYLSRVQAQLHKAQTNIKSLVDRLQTLEMKPVCISCVFKIDPDCFSSPVSL